MSATAETATETSKETYTSFQDILSDEELGTLFEKYGVQDERKRKLPVYWFFWLIVLSAAEPARRGSLLQLIGFFLGAIATLCSKKKVSSLTKSAVSKRLQSVTWYLFRGVYNHLLAKYKTLLAPQVSEYLRRFKDAFAIDGSVIALCKQLENTFKSTHKGKSSLKLNAKFSLQFNVVTKLQVSHGKRHDSRFFAVTQEAGLLYLVDLGYWSFRLLKKIIDAGSSFVMRLKSSCDPLIVAVAQAEYQHWVGKRLSEITDFLKELVPVGAIDLTVQLSTAKKPRFKDNIRLVGLLHEGQWRFYITNIFDIAFTPQLIYQLYAQRWQVEIFFNIIKNVLNLQNIMARTKNGIMIEIYAALIFHILTQIVIALAAQKVNQPIQQFSFERSFKLVKGFLLSNIQLFFQKSLAALDAIFQMLVDVVARMGLRQNVPEIIKMERELSPP
jgi:hypothetical protein